jgi:phage repressor protein C with HTH and peptisase S24 domain
MSSLSFRQRLEIAMADNGLRNGGALAKAMKLERTEVVYRLLRSDDNKPSYDFIEILYDALPNTNMDWLIKGKGERLSDNLDKTNKNNSLIHLSVDEVAETYNLPLKPAAGIPLVNFDAIAGLGNANFSIDKVNIQDRYTVPDFEKIDFMIKVRNNSMYPRYNSGDVVACRIIKSDNFIQWNRAHIVGAGDQGLLLKRIMPGDTDDTVQLISDNKDYPPIIIKRKEIHGLALVVGTIRLE